MKPILGKECLTDTERRAYEQMKKSPVKVLQIGEGNFLRGFFDWMIHSCRKQGLFSGSIAVIQPRPSGRHKLEQLCRQDGIYTLVIRGMEKGEWVEQRERIAVFSTLVDPYEDWPGFLAIAEKPELEWVVSNTTEAGLVYQRMEWNPEKPAESFPGKLTHFLYRRYLHFAGDPGKGLILLPCELVDRNGDELKACVLRHARDWGLPGAFLQWVDCHNRFLNSLVDRIVTGYPHTEAERWFDEWGYRDELLNTAEPYHFWAIEGEPELECRLPLRQAGLNVEWVADLRSFQLRKVRILNGAHTLMAPLGLLYGCSMVREVMEHPELSRFVRETVETEIIPSLPLDQQKMKKYAKSVFERFANPCIEHRLSDIVLNSVSKFRVRLLPSLQSFLAEQGRLPQGIVRALAGLIRFFQVRKEGEEYIGTNLAGQDYTVRDDWEILAFFHAQFAGCSVRNISQKERVGRILGNERLWGGDLTQVDGLPESVLQHLARMERETM
ncbi:tagaturonate reductase [Thermoactinomyces sp. CICC 10521]|uniref:tagaturonate reductase n=1 Tax=Thermoactinomyces sp. CICC 10521 TaxID=2767426 RepID=UPI0018DEBA72|nr:tagaturonate reductase [Thermoactinomyces sp. CICC 10521]